MWFYFILYQYRLSGYLYSLKFYIIFLLFSFFFSFVFFFFFFFFFFFLLNGIKGTYRYHFCWASVPFGPCTACRDHGILHWNQNEMIVYHSGHLRNECLFFWVHGEWIVARDKQIAWTAKRFSADLFVPRYDSFPMNPEKKTLIPYIYNASNQGPFQKFSEKNYKFKIPTVTGS